MSSWKSFGLALVGAACLVGETADLAQAQCVYGCATEWSNGSFLYLFGPSGALFSQANDINNLGQVAGVVSTDQEYATEWNGGRAIILGPGVAQGINDAGQVVGASGVSSVATERSGGGVIHLQGLPGSDGSYAYDINDAGQVVGGSYIFPTGNDEATEWSGGSVIDLGGLPGSIESYAFAINDAAQVVGYSTAGGVAYATEWSGGSIINLGGLAGSTDSIAYGLNGAGQVVGYSVVDGVDYATEWSGGSIIDLGPGIANGINDAGQVVGSGPAGGPTEWSDGAVIDLGMPPGFLGGAAAAINDTGQVVGVSFGPDVPEPSTWAMMLVGFAGLAFAGCRRAKTGNATLAPCPAGS